MPGRAAGRRAPAAANPIVVGVVLTLAMTAASAFQFVLGALAPAFSTDLGLSRSMLGGITAAYYLVAALASSVLGRRIGVVSSRTGTFLLFAIGACACVFAAAVATVWALALAGAVAGIAAGLSNPVTNLVIAGRGGRRGALVGVKQAGVQLSAVLVGLGMPALTVTYGWRGALAWLAGIMLAVGLVAASGAPTSHTPRQFRQVTKQPLPPAVRWLCCYAFFMGAGMATFTTYLVLYGHDRLGLGASTAGMLLATFGAAGATGRLVSSVLAERGDRLGTWMTAGAFVAVAGVALFATTTNLMLVWAGIMVVGLSGAAWNGVVMLAVLRLSGEGQTGHATGVVLTGFFLGLGVAPPVFGAVVDATQAYGLGWLLTGACFAAAGVVMLTMSRRTQLASVGATRDLDAPLPPL